MKIERHHNPEQQATMSHATDSPRMIELLHAHDRLNEELCSNAVHSQEQRMELIQQITAIRNEIMCEEYPHLKGQTCPICDKKFNGWGNNPAPLNTDKVCDSCNMNIIVPVRMGHKKLEKVVKKMLLKKMLTGDYEVKKM
jgi:hypothetical protein